MIARIRRYLIAGFLVWLPIWITFLSVHFLINTMDDMFRMLPNAYHPDTLLGRHIPGFGLLRVASPGLGTEHNADPY